MLGIEHHFQHFFQLTQLWYSQLEKNVENGVLSQAYLQAEIELTVTASLVGYWAFVPCNQLRLLQNPGLSPGCWYIFPQTALDRHSMRWTQEIVLRWHANLHPTAS